MRGLGMSRYSAGERQQCTGWWPPSLVGSQREQVIVRKRNSPAGRGEPLSRKYTPHYIGKTNTCGFPQNQTLGVKAVTLHATLNRSSLCHGVQEINNSPPFPSKLYCPLNQNEPKFLATARSKNWYRVAMQLLYRLYGLGAQQYGSAAPQREITAGRSPASSWLWSCWPHGSDHCPYHMIFRVLSVHVRYSHIMQKNEICVMDPLSSPWQLCPT